MLCAGVEQGGDFRSSYLSVTAWAYFLAECKKFQINTKKYCFGFSLSTAFLYSRCVILFRCRSLLWRQWRPLCLPKQGQNLSLLSLWPALLPYLPPFQFAHCLHLRSKQTPPQNGTLQLSGIVSWGVIPCAQSLYPSVYTNVGYFRFDQQGIIIMATPCLTPIVFYRNVQLFSLAIFFTNWKSFRTREWIDEHLALWVVGRDESQSLPWYCSWRIKTKFWKELSWKFNLLCKPANLSLFPMCWTLTAGHWTLDSGRCQKQK